MLIHGLLGSQYFPVKESFVLEKILWIEYFVPLVSDFLIREY